MFRSFPYSILIIFFPTFYGCSSVLWKCIVWVVEPSISFSVWFGSSWLQIPEMAQVLLLFFSISWKMLLASICLSVHKCGKGWCRGGERSQLPMGPFWMFSQPFPLSFFVAFFFSLALWKRMRQMDGDKSKAGLCRFQTGGIYFLVCQKMGAQGEENQLQNSFAAIHNSPWYPMSYTPRSLQNYLSQ